MPVARRQRTLARPTTVTGFGYFSGRDVRVEFWPAPEGSGITFVRHDLGIGARIPALAEFRSDVPRRTNLELDGASVEMVEHVLAALAGLRVDNCEIWVDAPEMPGCDGSAIQFVEAIEGAGIVEQGAPVRQIVVQQRVRVGDGESWMEAQPSRTAGLSISFELDFGPATSIGHQRYALDLTPASFRKEVAPCRTFIEESVAKAMASQGIGERVTPHDLLIFGPHGPIDNPLRFPDECVRHKALDVVGDLALTGCEVIAHVVAYRSGHRLHAELARRLVELADPPVAQQSGAALRRCA